MLASCVSFLRSHPTLRLCDEPPDSSLLSSEGAGRDGKEDGAVSEVEEGRSGQQSTRDDVDASPLVPLLWGGERDVRGGGRVKKGRSEEQGMTDDTDASSVTRLHLAPVLCVQYERLRWSRLCSEGAGMSSRTEAAAVEESRCGVISN